MNDSSANPFDLTIARIIHAPRQRVWNAWADPSNFEKWWIPAPLTCQVREMDLRPGGSFRTDMGEDGTALEPHITGCFLAVEELERIVFTDALVAGWRPADSPFVTASFTFADHAEGTLYTSTAMHRNQADRNKHEQLGFHDGWGTVITQLAELVEPQ